MSILCRLGLHAWKHQHDFFEKGKMVVKWIYSARCKRCGKKLREIYEYNSKTGEPIK